MRREEKIFALILLTPKFWVKLFLWSEMTNDRKVTDPSDHSTDQPWWSTKKLSHLFEVLFLLAACQISDDDDPDKKRPQCCCGQFLPQNFTSLRDTSNVINVEKKYFWSFINLAKFTLNTRFVSFHFSEWKCLPFFLSEVFNYTDWLPMISV